MTQSFPSPNLSTIPNHDDIHFFDTPFIPQSKHNSHQPISTTFSNDNTNFKTNEKNEEASKLISSFLYSENDSNKVHSGIPFSKINDEAFKLNYIKNHLKPSYHNKHWTDTQKTFLVNHQQKSNEERYKLLQTRMSISAQKLYTSRIPFTTPHNHLDYFNIYNSSDIGIDSKWDDHLPSQMYDNDTETPSQVIAQAYDDNLMYLNKGMKQFTNNKMSVHHYHP